MKIPFVWLGSKRSAKRGVGEKGALLDQAARARLPVPNGGILLHEFYELLRDAGIARVDGGQVIVEIPSELFEALYTAVRFPRLSKETAVRAAFSTADRLPVQTCPPRLHVDAEDAPALTKALCAVWSAAGAQAAVRRDVIIQEMVASAVGGTAVLLEDAREDEITVTHDAPVTLTLPHFSRWKRPLARRPPTHLPPYAQRLQMLLQGVRRTFGRGDWAITWADDGEICWLLQVRPHTPRSTNHESVS